MKALRIAGIIFAAAVLAVCLWESRRLIAIGFGGCDGSGVVLRHRRIVERFVPRGERVTLLRNDSKERPSHVCRSIFLAIAWAAGAGNVEEKRTLDGNERYVVPAPTRRVPKALAENPLYRELGGDGVGRIWIRGDAPTRDSGSQGEDEVRLVRDARIAAIARECADWREVLGLVVPIGLAVLLVAVGLGRRPRPAEWVCCAAVLVVNALFALSHTFTGPCGTGVFGGRAKALVESGWNLSRLADPNMGEYFQASYPPLQAIVTAVGYSISGMCGEWITQLGPVVFLAAAFLVMAGMRCDEDGCANSSSAAWCILLASACVTRPMIHATGNFCAEPLLLLTLAVGWSMVVRGDNRGWILVGLSGLVKNEGLVYVPAVVAAEAVAGRLKFRGMVHLALGLVPVALWHVYCRFKGAMLYDYASPWQCDLLRAAGAARELVREVVVHPWRYVFALLLPVAVVRRALSHGRGASSCRRFVWWGAVRAALPVYVFFMVFAFGICYAFSLSRAPDFAWHVSCMPRLLAPAAALALANAGLVSWRNNCYENGVF